MSKFIVHQKGVVNVNNRDVRTPCEIKVRGKNVNLVKTQLNYLGIEYSIKRTSLPVIDTSHKYVLNYRRDNADKRDFKIKTVLPESPRLKAKTIVDYTNQMSPVKDQGMLGSCVGFATVAMKEYQEQKEHLREVQEGKSYKRKQKHYDLSEQWLYYKCKEIDDWPNEEGTSLRYAMKVLNKIGVPCESAWPYSDVIIGKPKRWAKLIARWALGGEYYRIETPLELVQALKECGPVVIGIICYEEIFNVSSNGIIPDPAEPWNWYGGHAVCCVGWNPNTKLFKFKNSWGTSWGENGYGYVSINYIAEHMLDAWVIKDVNVTKEMLKGD